VESPSSADRSLSQVSGVRAINPLVAFYDTHGRKNEVPFFYFVPDTTQGMYITLYVTLYIAPLIKGGPNAK
jgi:hypothetical protein